MCCVCVQENAEQAVREMLRNFSEEQGLPEVHPRGQEIF